MFFVHFILFFIVTFKKNGFWIGLDSGPEDFAFPTPCFGPMSVFHLDSVHFTFAYTPPCHFHLFNLFCLFLIYLNYFPYVKNSQLIHSCYFGYYLFLHIFISNF